MNPQATLDTLVSSITAYYTHRNEGNLSAAYAEMDRVDSSADALYEWLASKGAAPILSKQVKYLLIRFSASRERGRDTPIDSIIRLIDAATCDFCGAKCFVEVV